VKVKMVTRIGATLTLNEVEMVLVHTSLLTMGNVLESIPKSLRAYEPNTPKTLAIGMAAAIRAARELREESHGEPREALEE